MICRKYVRHAVAPKRRRENNRPSHPTRQTRRSPPLFLARKNNRKQCRIYFHGGRNPQHCAGKKWPIPEIRPRCERQQEASIHELARIESCYGAEQRLEK